MKKNIFLLVFLGLFFSCKSTQISEPTIIEKKVYDTLKIETIKYEKEIVSLPIDDKMIIAINTSKDSICEDQINKVLSQINFTKQSGDNEYQILYNKSKKQIEIIAKMRELLNKTNTSSTDKQQSTFERVEVPVPTPVYTNILKRWQIILMILGALFPLYHIIRLILKFYRP